MTREGYKPGDWYLIDDTTGVKVRASDTKQQWDGAVTHKQNFDPRHPQDLVRAVPDNPNPPFTRPRGADQFIGPLQTTLTQAAAARTNQLFVESNVRMQVGDRITLNLANGDTFTTFITTIAALGQIQISPVLLSRADIGAVVTDYTATATGDLP